MQSEPITWRPVVLLFEWLPIPLAAVGPIFYASQTSNGDSIGEVLAITFALFSLMMVFWYTAVRFILRVQIRVLFPMVLTISLFGIIAVSTFLASVL